MDITLLIKICFMILAAGYTYILAPYLKSKATAAQFDNLKEYVMVGVQAAEQIYRDPNMGQKKKEYVLRYLNEKGYTVNASEIDAMIESAVLDLKEWLK